MNGMAAADGMVVYNTTDGAMYLRKSNAWQKLGDAGNNNGGGALSFPHTSSHVADDGYVLSLTNNSFTGVNGGIKGHSSTSGYGIYGSSFTGIGGYFTSQIGSSLVTGAGPVGFGTPSPAAKVHAVANNQDLLQLENTTALANGQGVRTLFKTGNFYTGGIGTMGTGALAARVSIFSGVALTPVSLTERMSILFNGNVGLSQINPQARLDVAGKIKATAQAGDDAALELTGAIKVTGNSQAAFVLTATVANISEKGHVITIDHPHCNFDPNAILFVTGRKNQDFKLNYNPNTGKWYLYTDHMESSGWIDLAFKDCNNACAKYTMQMTPEPMYFSTGDKFNILIIKAQ
jgi:hypothetical protein